MSNLAKLKKNAAEFEQKRQFDRALAAYEEVLRAQDGSEELDVSLYNRVGDLHLRQGRAADALRSYERAADLYIERGFHNNAIALCNKILRQDPTRAEVHYKLGRVSAMKGFRTDARQHFLEYATLMQKAGKLDESFAALQEFADLAPEHDDLRLLLADQLARHGRAEQAVAQLRILLEQYDREQRLADAQQVRERIHALDPSFLGQAGELAGAAYDGLAESPVAPRRPSPAPGSSRAPGMPELVLIEPSSFSGARDGTTPAGARPVVTPTSPAAGVPSVTPTSNELPADDEVGPLGRRSRPVEMPEGLIRGADVDFETDASLPFTVDDVQVSPLVDGLDSAHGVEGVPARDGADGFGPMAGLMPTAGAEEPAAGGERGSGERAGITGRAGALGDADALALTTDDDPEGEDDELLVELPFLTEVPGSGSARTSGETTSGIAGERDADGGFDLVLSDDPAAQDGDRWTIDDVAADPRPGGAGAGAAAGGPSRSGRLAAARTSLVLGDHEAALRTIDALVADYDAAGEPQAADAALDELLEAAPATVPLLERRAARARLRGDQERARALQAQIRELEPRHGTEGAYGLRRTPLRPARPVPPAPVVERSALPTPLATRPVPQTPIGTRVVEEPARARNSGWVNLGDLLREEEGPRSTRLVVEERAPSGDEQADFSAMLRKFKQGVAENVDEEDYESHYDLGVAYKEMGLVDDAIAQFQRALRGPQLRSRAYEALGQCFVDRGQYAVATAVLERATAEPGLDDQQLVGVLYLLGRAAEAMNNRSDALRYYQRVLAVDITFSDVAERMGMVEQVPR